jgi:hypothetical protein
MERESATLLKNNRVSSKPITEASVPYRSVSSKPERQNP